MYMWFRLRREPRLLAAALPATGEAGARENDWRLSFRAVMEADYNRRIRRVKHVLSGSDFGQTESVLLISGSPRDRSEPSARGAVVS